MFNQHVICLHYGATCEQAATLERPKRLRYILAELCAELSYKRMKIPFLRSLYRILTES